MWVFSSITMFLSQSNFCVLIIRWLVVNLVRGGGLLENRDPEQPMYILWASVESLRCCPVTQSRLPRFIRAIICLYPCVP